MFYLHKLCVASKQIFVVVVVVVVVVSAAAVNFVFDSVQKLLNIPSYVHRFQANCGLLISNLWSLNY